jgi:hypothetical protein
MIVFVVGIALYGSLALLTAVGSRRRGTDASHSVAEAFAWPFTWVAWFIADNRAEGRPWFQGHRR